MGKKVYFNTDNVLKIKESMANDKFICHTFSCNNVNEAAPEIDVFKIGAEKNSPVGGTIYHEAENIDESTSRIFNVESISSKSIMISENQLKSIKENIDLEVNSSDIDLSSFKKRDELPPNIWKGDILDSKVRLKLLDIADDFWKFIDLRWVKPKHIILTGSICNFNWSSESDIDLHLIVDFNEVDEKTEFVRDYFDSKKNEWNNEHNNLTIFGHKVELYVQDLDDETESNGMYDLEENDWIKEPNPNDVKPIELNKFSIKDKAAKIMTIIDDMYDAFSSTDDAYEIRQIGDDAKYLCKKIKDMRKSSLDKDGESGDGNIIYKYMRKAGYLDKLWKLSDLVYDKSNSINESINKPSEEEYYAAKNAIYDSKNVEDYDYYKSIIDKYEEDENLYNKLLMFSTDQFLAGKSRNSKYMMPNGKIISLHYHDSVTEIGLTKQELLEKGVIRFIGESYSNYFYLELSKCPNEIQESKLLYYFKTIHGDIYVDITSRRELKKHFTFDRKTFSPELIMDSIKNYFSVTTESVKKYIALLKEEYALDGNTEHNPYKKRWDAERKALKNFICNNGVLMQSKEDDKNGKLYKCFTDTWLSNLIGYNYCVAVQYDEINNKPKSTIYVRALDKFTPFIRRNLQYDTRGKDNQIGTMDDINNRRY